MKTITADILRKQLSYNKTTGIFTWLVKTNATNIGDIAGSERGADYSSIGINGKKWMSHRIAFLWMTGKFPKNQVDHINGDRSDNRWNNLREATPAQNKQNQRNPSKCSKTQLLGVYKRGDRFIAQIGHDRKSIHLGVFDTPENAHSAYLSAKQKMHEYSTIGLKNG